MLLTADHFQRIARALAEPTRYEMLRRIYASDATVSCGTTFDGLPICAATGSHHLRELEQAGLIDVRKEGRFRWLTPRRETWQAYLARLAEM